MADTENDGRLLGVPNEADESPGPTARSVNHPTGHEDDERRPLLATHDPGRARVDSDVARCADWLASLTMALLATSHDFVPIQTVNRRNGPVFLPLLGLLLILNILYAELQRRTQASEGELGGLVPPNHWVLPHSFRHPFRMHRFVERPFQLTFLVSLTLMPLYAALVYAVLSDLLGHSQSEDDRETANWIVLGVLGGAQCLMGLHAWRGRWGMGVVRRCFHDHAKIYYAYHRRATRWCLLYVGMLLSTGLSGAALYYLNQRVLALLFSRGQTYKPACLLPSDAHWSKDLALPWAVLMAISVHMLTAPTLRRLLLNEAGFQVKRIQPRFLMVAMVHGAVHAYALFIMLNAGFNTPVLTDDHCDSEGKLQVITPESSGDELGWAIATSLCVTLYTLVYWIPIIWCRPVTMSSESDPWRFFRSSDLRGEGGASEGVETEAGHPSHEGEAGSAGSGHDTEPPLRVDIGYMEDDSSGAEGGDERPISPSKSGASDASAVTTF